MVSCTFLIITLIFGMCWISYAQSNADSEGTVQFCGRTLIAEVTKICRNRNSRGLDGERPLIVNLRSLLHNLFSRDTITNECCKRPCTKSHIIRHYCYDRRSISM